MKRTETKLVAVKYNDATVEATDILGKKHTVVFDGAVDLYKGHPIHGIAASVTARSGVDASVGFSDYRHLTGLGVSLNAKHVVSVKLKKKTRRTAHYIETTEVSKGWFSKERRLVTGYKRVECE